MARLGKCTVIEHDNMPDISVWSGGNKAPTFLFIHGFGDGSFVWDTLIPDICGAARFVSVDLRGHGNSGWDPCRRYGIADYGMDILRVCRQLDLHRPIMVGHSLGGAICVWLAMQGHITPAALVLIDYCPDMNLGGVAAVRTAFAAEKQVYESRNAYADYLRQARPLAQPPAIEHIARHALRVGSDGRFTLLRDPALVCGRDDDWAGDTQASWNALAAIVCPLLIVRGQASALVSEHMAMHMKSVARDATVQTIARSGHAVMTDNPAGLVDAICDFFNARDMDRL